MVKWIEKIKELFKREDTEAKRSVPFASTDKELTPQKKGELAEQIISNPIYCDVIKQIKTEILGMWENTLVMRTDEREKYFLMLKALDKVDGRFRGLVNEAKYEMKIMEEKAKNGISNSK